MIVTRSQVDLLETHVAQILPKTMPSVADETNYNQWRFWLQRSGLLARAQEAFCNQAHERIGEQYLWSGSAVSVTS